MQQISTEREYKTRQNWVGIVIHWEMWITFKIDNANKWYMYKPAPVLKNDTHELLLMLTYKRIT